MPKKPTIATQKAQVWYLDFIIGMVFFVAMVALFFQYSINIFNSDNAQMQELILDGRAVADSLCSEGSPLNWNASTVERIGIAEHMKINETKLAAFVAMGTSDYFKTKSLFGIRNDYYFFLQSGNGTAFAVTGNYPLNVSRKATIERIVFYNGTIQKMVVYAWSQE